MKNVVLLILLSIGGLVYAQTPTTEQRKQHIMETYGVSEKQATNYELLRKRLLAENNSLKEEKISSEQFRKKQKTIYKSYGDMVGQLFSEEKGNLWKFLTQELERYQILGEDMLVPELQMTQLIKAERKWNQEMKLLKDNKEKYKKRDELLANLHTQLYQILGKRTGDWYIDYKDKAISTLNNMDKYSASYAEAYKITCIEQQFKNRKAAILKEQKKYAEKEIDIIRLENQKEKDITSCLSPQIAMRWKKINSESIDHALKNKYKLSAAQISSFKKAYGKYAIEKYKILQKSKLSQAERYEQLCNANENFIQAVKPLFSPSTYNKWETWWKYKTEKETKRKCFK